MIQNKRGTTSSWSSSSDILDSGQLALEYGADTVRAKAGNGTDTFKNLNYLNGRATYTSFADLGLEDDASIDDIVSAIPDGAILTLLCTNNSVFPTSAGGCTIINVNNGYRTLLIYTNMLLADSDPDPYVNAANRYWIGTYRKSANQKFSGWLELAYSKSGDPVSADGQYVDRIAKPIYLGDQDTIDFDTITDPGIYYSNTSTSLEDDAILNFPDYNIPRSGRGFVLTMYLAQGTMTQVLRLVSPAYPYTYERRYKWWDPKGWGDWTKVVSSDVAGNISVKGYNRIDLTNTTTDVDTLNLNTGIPQQAFYYCRTSGGAANISNIPVVGQPFLLDVKVIRYTSTKDFITLQEFISGTDLIRNREFKYYRYCRNGTWSDWLQEKIIPSNNEIPVYDSWADLGLTLSSTSPATFIVDAINKMATPSIGRFLVNRNPSDIFPDTYGICTIYKAATTLSTLEFVRPFVSGTDSRAVSYVATYRPDYPGIVWYETTVPRTVAANRVLISDANGAIASSAVTSTELGYLDGVTSSIQTQLNNRVTTNTTQTITGTKTFSNTLTAPNIVLESGQIKSNRGFIISAALDSGIQFMGAENATFAMPLNTQDVNMSGDLLPKTNNTSSIGSSSLKLKSVYATTFYGALSGNATSATSATKATQDGNGKVIANTYFDLTKTTSQVVQGPAVFNKLITAHAGINPGTNNTDNLGTTSLKWANVYATNFVGNLNGNATTASRATYDAKGNEIFSSYLHLNQTAVEQVNTPCSFNKPLTLGANITPKTNKTLSLGGIDNWFLTGFIQIMQCENISTNYSEGTNSRFANYAYQGSASPFTRNNLLMVDTSNAEYHTFDQATPDVVMNSTYRLDIPSGGNFNNYVELGAYAVSSGTISTSLQNCPYKDAGTLWVIPGVSNIGSRYIYRLQLWITYSGNHWHIRYLWKNGSSASWSYGTWRTFFNQT